jgi:NAD-dependent deacetylase sirtuin 5
VPRGGWAQRTIWFGHLAWVEWLWNDINLRELASPNKFFEDPVTVWTFYDEHLVRSLAAQPNSAHHALAALATWHEGWLTINQNVDGTSL